MEPLTEGLHLAGSVVDLTKDLLTRADRDGPVKDLHDTLNKIQNSFANNDLDSQWAIAYGLLTNVGHSFATGGSLGDTERQFRHAALVSIAELKYLKEIISRVLTERVKPQ